VEEREWMRTKILVWRSGKEKKFSLFHEARAHRRRFPHDKGPVKFAEDATYLIML